MVSQTVLLLYIQKQKGVFQNMKKQKITTLLLTMALCASAVLSGCAASAASQTEPNQSTTSSTPFEEAKDSGTPISSDEASSVQAYENDEVLSSEEQAKAEQERRAEIAEKYSIYEPYGMTYDTEKDRFFYNGQVVRYFKDHINSNETNGFSYDDGVIDVEPIRDEDVGIVAEMNTMRLLEHKKVYLTLTRMSDSKELMKVDLIPYLLLTKMEGHNIPAQEYLDRQSEYAIVFFYNPELLNFLSTKIVINGWTIWLKGEDL